VPRSGLPVPLRRTFATGILPSLTRCWLRSAIHGCAGQQRRLRGTGSPELGPSICSLLGSSLV